MKRLKLKGFTLIECIVAMAIIGIASMLIAQVYGAVAIMNRNNARINTSLIEQVKLAEKEITDNDPTTSGIKVDTVSLYSYANSSEGISKSLDGMSFSVKTSLPGDSSYSSKGYDGKFKIIADEYDGSSPSRWADVDVIVLKPQEKTETVGGRSYGMTDDVRYKFILPAQHK